MITKIKSSYFLIMLLVFSACNPQKHDRAEIDTVLDQWHAAAANADEDTFFGSMTEDAVYLGTDASERWLRDELRTWSAEYFERESAWSFKPVKREVYFSEDGHYAWFEELLETWMGNCRGSGVLHLEKDGWKIKHYNLAVTIHNDLIRDFIDILKKDPANSYLDKEIISE